MRTTIGYDVGMMKSIHCVNCRFVRCRRGCKYAKANERKTVRRQRYGLSPEQQRALLKSQHSRCAMCDCPLGGDSGNTPCLDHDHTTGMARGYLCTSCNTAIAIFDHAGTLERALAYLENPPISRIDDLTCGNK